MKLMVCYDASDHARRALDLARKHAVMMNGEIVVVASVLLEDSFQATEKQELEDELRPVQASCEEKGVPFGIHLSSRGLEAAEDLACYASENDVDLIYIGLQKRSKVGKFILGSTVQDLLIAAECPVVVVNP